MAVMIFAVTACTGEATDQAQFVEPSATPATSVAPSPAQKAPRNKDEVRKRIELAALDLSTFHTETGTPTEDNTEPWKLAATCRTLPSDQQRTAHHEWLWDGKTVWIRHYVVGYLKVPGRKLLGELRGSLSDCKSYEASDGRKTTILTATVPELPEGTESVAYCERLQGNNVVHQCTAVLARGNFVAQIDAADHNELEASQTMLAKLAPLVAEALGKAA